MDLKQTAQEIREVIKQYQEKHHLTFEEENHKYTMDGMPDNALSVSGVLGKFYEKFVAENTWAFKKLKGNKELEDLLLEEWRIKGELAAETGSLTHFLSEEYSLELFGLDKEVRKPMFDCDAEQTGIAERKFESAKKFLHLMKDRGAVIMNTEIVSGSTELQYFGQGDTYFLMENKAGEAGIIITDYKTNRRPNFEPQNYTKPMKAPFEYLPSTALGHYYIQLPLYGQLLKYMLKGSKFEKIPIFGGVVVLLEEDGFEEFKIPGKVFDQVMNLNVKDYL